MAGLLTVAHGYRDTLADTLATMLQCWHQVWAGRRRTEAADTWGFVGAVRHVETTHGDSGWHPHVHFLAFCDRELSKAEVSAFRAWILAKHGDALARIGAPPPSPDAQGLDPVREAAAAAAYVTKGTGKSPSGAVRDTLGGAHKVAREERERRTPFQILDCLLAAPTERDVALWYEYEQATAGRRALGWICRRAVVKAYHLSETPDDLAAAETPDDSPRAVLVVVPHEMWAVVRRGCLEAALLAAADAREHEPARWAGIEILAAHWRGPPAAELFELAGGELEAVRALLAPWCNTTRSVTP